MKDAGDKVKPEDKKEVDEKINTVREALKGDKADEIENATKGLSDSIQKVGAAMYTQPGQPPTGDSQQPMGNDQQAASGDQSTGGGTAAEGPKAEGDKPKEEVEEGQVVS